MTQPSRKKIYRFSNKPKSSAERLKYSDQQVKTLNQAIKQFFPEVRTIQPEYKLTFSGVSRLVMLDRYSQKDLRLITLQENDLVLTIIKEDKMFSVRAVGRVHKIYQNTVEIKIENEYLGQVNPKDLKPGSDSIIIREKRFIDKPLEIYYEQIAFRVACGLAKQEKKSKQKYWRDCFFKQISAKKIVPAGRVLFGTGSKAKVTLFNCFVLPMIQDSRSGIARHRQKTMEIMAHGGGVGTNGSTLRPKGVIAKTVGGRSSGSVSWLNDISQLTHLVEQGGSRRGAQMIMMADWHPDVIEFMVSKIQNPLILRWMLKNLKNRLIVKNLQRKIKFIALTSNKRRKLERIVQHPEIFSSQTVTKAQQELKTGGKWIVNNPDFLTGANISVLLTNDFMKAVENDDLWELRFPDLANYTPSEKKDYDQHWNEVGDVREWARRNPKVKTYTKIKAREMWDLICFCATYSAEPGIFFIDRANEMTNAQAYGMKVVATNPCAEQPLAPYSVCNLAALNLAEFVDRKTQKVNFKALQESVEICVRLQDNVIDATHYFSHKNKKQAIGERRMGMGVMGLSDLLIWVGVRYGSKESLKLVDKIFHTIARHAYLSSTNLAVEKGSFPFLAGNTEVFLKTGYMKRMDSDVRDLIRRQGIRNSHLLTVAPTGTTSTLMGVANGLEPYFAFKYYRSGRLGKFMEISAPIVQEWKAIHSKTDQDKLPDFFVSAQELKPEDHVNIQCAIQRWVDSSISKTVNAPRGYTVRQVEAIYMDLFKKGAKTGTVYVDGSRDSQVLSLSQEDHQFEAIEKTLKPKKIQQTKRKKPLLKKCIVCHEGTLVLAGGCDTCNRCGAQTKCGL